MSLVYIDIKFSNIYIDKEYSIDSNLLPRPAKNTSIINYF